MGGGEGVWWKGVEWGVEGCGGRGWRGVMAGGGGV